MKMVMLNGMAFSVRGQFNADQESYWWMDDNADDKMFNRYGFLPDANNPSEKVKLFGLAAADCSGVIF